MALKRTPNPTFPFFASGIEPGSNEPVALIGKHKTRDVLQDFLANAPGRPDVEVVGELLAGWPGVKEEFGELDRDTLAEFLNIYPAAGAKIVEAYIEALTGARLGN